MNTQVKRAHALMLFVNIEAFGINPVSKRVVSNEYCDWSNLYTSKF